MLEKVWRELELGLGVLFARMAFELSVISIPGERFDLTAVEREGFAFPVPAKYADDVVASPTGDSRFLSTVVYYMEPA